MGVIAHRLRTLDRLLIPPSTRHVSAELPSNNSPIPSEVISEVLEPLDNFSKYPLFPPKNRIVRGGRGVPEIFFGLESLIFLLLRSPCKISEPYVLKI